MNITTPLLPLLISFVAFLYASVGHGGASGYLAILAFFAFPHQQMATSALILNLAVAGAAWFTYTRAHYFPLRQAVPFLATSVPGAFLGGLIHLPFQLYEYLLGGALLFAAFRLAFGNIEKTEPVFILHWQLAMAIGFSIGLLSGIVGVGGGIFLSPLLLLGGFTTVKQTAAISACFIWTNSLAGLLGRMLSGQFDAALVSAFILPALIGGWLGAHLGARQFSPLSLQRLLAIVLVIAAIKAICTAWGI